MLRNELNAANYLYFMYINGITIKILIAYVRHAWKIACIFVTFGIFSRYETRMLLN